MCSLFEETEGKKKKMIFQKEHINHILKGSKTQTRRVHSGKYREGRRYGIQPCRTCKGIESYRIVMDRIWKERYAQYLCCYISEEDARAEGGYKSPIEFEEVFRKLNPKWAGDRWVFEFHVIEVRK